MPSLVLLIVLILKASPGTLSSLWGAAAVCFRNNSCHFSLWAANIRWVDSFFFFFLPPLRSGDVKSFFLSPSDPVTGLQTVLKTEPTDCGRWHLWQSNYFGQGKEIKHDEGEQPSVKGVWPHRGPCPSSVIAKADFCQDFAGQPFLLSF